MNIVEITELKKKYANRIIFEGLNIDIPEKGIILLKGKNGIGKSTLLKIISKMTKYDSGFVNYKDPCFFEKSAFLLDIPIFLESLNFRDNMELVGSLLKISQDDVNKNIAEYGELFSLPPNTLYGEFSLGMRKKAEIARTFINDPKYIFWDEPFNSLDEQSIKIVCEKLINKSKLYFVISHERYLDEKATRIIEF